MPYEDPHALMLRRRPWREEYCQALLGMLILGETPTRWNLRRQPTAEGVAFLRLLDARSFGSSGLPDALDFVHELELAPRSPGEPGGGPDWAVLLDDRVWLIELKTDRGSHTKGQLPLYFELGAHHFPGLPLDITYLTPPMPNPAPTTLPGQRYAHVTWDHVAPLVVEVWGGDEQPDVVRVRDVLLETLATLDVPSGTWRAQQLGEEAAQPQETPAEPLELARRTAADGKQRVVDVRVADLQELHDLRLELERALAAEPELAHVQPWLWRVASTGRAMSAGGAETGFELRLSRTAKPVR